MGSVETNFSLFLQTLINLLATDPARKTFIDGLGNKQHSFYRAVVNLGREENRRGRGPYRMEWVSDLMVWAAAHEVPDTKEELDRMQEDTLVVLPGFGAEVQAVAFSCRGMLENIRDAKRTRPEWVNVMIDGTYKLDYIKWTLISVGTTSLRWNREHNDLVTQFIPFGYCFANVESEGNVLVLLNGLKEVAARFYDIQFDDSWVKVSLWNLWESVAVCGINLWYVWDYSVGSIAMMVYSLSLFR